MSKKMYGRHRKQQNTAFQLHQTLHATILAVIKQQMLVKYKIYSQFSIWL